MKEPYRYYLVLKIFALPLLMYYLIISLLSYYIDIIDTNLASLHPALINESINIL